MLDVISADAPKSECTELFWSDFMLALKLQTHVAMEDIPRDGVPSIH